MRGGCGARGGDRTRTPLRIRDFKSLASAISPPGQRGGLWRILGAVAIRMRGGRRLFGEAVDFAGALEEFAEAGGFAAALHFLFDDEVDEEGIVDGAVGLHVGNVEAEGGEEVGKAVGAGVGEPVAEEDEAVEDDVFRGGHAVALGFGGDEADVEGGGVGDVEGPVDEF